MPLPVEIDQEVLVLPSFTLECGETLRNVPVAYKTWGKLNEQRDNVMIICHAFTGSSDVEDWCALPYLRHYSSSHSFSFLCVSPYRSPARSGSETTGFLLITTDAFQQIGGVR